MIAMGDSLFITKKVEIQAPIKSVWDALTNPEIRKQYMYCEADSNWKKNDPISWKGHNKNGEEIVFVKGQI